MKNGLLIKIAQAQAAFAAATVGLYSEEEGADAKVTDAFSQLNEAMDEFNAEYCSPGGASGDKDDANKDGNYQGQEPQELLDLPEEPELDDSPSGTGPATRTEIRGKTSSPMYTNDNKNNEQFSALQSEVTALRGTVEKQNGLIGQFKTVVGGMAAKLAKQEFSTFVNGLIQDGHEVDQAAANEMFSAVIGDKNAVEKLKNMLKKTAKSKLQTTVFGADANSPDTGGAAKDFSALSKEVTDLLNYAAPGISFSDEDMALAKAMNF